MFVYALYLIKLLEQPFQKGDATFDNVSLFLLTEFVEQLDKPSGQRGLPIAPGLDDIT
jgi:hypothetical protein